jgi:hypothetical protein
MSEARLLTKRIAVSILAREGIEAIWKLHVAAGEAHRTGHARAAAAIVEIAEAAEHERLSGGQGSCLADVIASLPIQPDTFNRPRQV